MGSNPIARSKESIMKETIIKVLAFITALLFVAGFVLVLDWCGSPKTHRSSYVDCKCRTVVAGNLKTLCCKCPNFSTHQICGTYGEYKESEER